MSRVPGYNVVIRAFIPAPKGDFKAQASAADIMHNMSELKTIPPEFIKVAKVIDVKGVYGSMAEEETPPDPPAEEQPQPEPTSKRKPPAAA
jgi:hypothetical protein